MRSRDAWKAKASARKAQRKTLEIRVRDLAVSRDHHRQRAEQLHEQVAQLHEQVTQLHEQLASARSAAAASPTPRDSPKNSTVPAAGTTASASSTSP